VQKITFAKSKSDAVAMKEGSVEPRYKRKKREEKLKEKMVSIYVSGLDKIEV